MDGEVHLFNPYRTQIGPGEWVEGFKEDTVHDALTKNPPPKGPPLVVQSLPTDSRIAKEIAPTLQAAKSEARGGTAGPLVYVSAASSPGSEGSTRDSGAQGGATPSSANPTATGGTCFVPGSPECPSTTTYETSLFHENIDGKVYESPEVPALRNWQKDAPMLLTSSVEGSPVRTSPSPDNAAGSPAAAPGCSSSSPGSQTLFDPDSYSSRTYPGCSARTAVGTSESFLERWPTSGTAWAGGFSTAVSSECRSDAGVCSSLECSLTGILQPPQDVPDDYLLSGRAARGILRRAERRGRTLPGHLAAALEAVAGRRTPSE